MEPGKVTPIRKLLVANRGEIARRVMRTCREMGIISAAVFTEADARAAHVDEADEAVRLAGDTPLAGYLSVSGLVDAAARVGADAMHPGYGFLSEHAGFAAACRDAGLIFVGPEPDVIASMGLKREARQMMAAAGVPVAPGYDGDDQTDARLLAEADRIGYPLMVKASAGGGGKGMRLVARDEDVLGALASARREAQSAFGDATLLLEKAIESPRHIEFQLFGDRFGGLVHLGERECSIQRRHQKLIEETPAPGLTAKLRERMSAAALTVGRTLGYTNAGTVEFIVDPEGEFYFLEVNTRLQVEHPVTELVTGLDLVRWQIEIAEGRPLPLRQEQIMSNGHAIEARVYAEDPEAGFQPSSGRLYQWREPTQARVDTGVRPGDDITPYFDPLIAKISVHAPSRDEAARRLAHAVESVVALGVRTNSAFLARALRHPAFLAGDTTTAFILQHHEALTSPGRPEPDAPASAETAALFAALARLPAAGRSGQWRWRNNPPAALVERFGAVASEQGHLTSESDIITVSLSAVGSRRYHASRASSRGAWSGLIEERERDAHRLVAEIDGRIIAADVAQGVGHDMWVALAGRTWTLRWLSPLPEPGERKHTAGSLTAPLPGVITTVLVETGQLAHAGDPLMTLEAMKMEHTIRAPWDGIVSAVHFTVGERINAGAVVMDMAPEPDGGSSPVTTVASGEPE